MSNNSVSESGSVNSNNSLEDNMNTVEAVVVKRGKKACDISARTLFSLIDAMGKGDESLQVVRGFIDAEDEEGLNNLMNSVFKKNKSVTGKPGRPISPNVLGLLSERGVTVEKLYSMDAKERRALIAQAHAHLKFATLNK